MGNGERLLYASRCRLCGAEIEVGTPLESLSWDPERRAWAHRNPRCEGSKAPAAEAPASLHPSNGASSPPAASPSSPEGGAHPGKDPPGSLGPGAWSVTVEIHEAEDPAQSKRVVRIARLHLRSLEEAREVAELLRKAAEPAQWD